MAEYLLCYAQSGIACKSVLSLELAGANPAPRLHRFNGETTTPGELRINVDRGQYRRCKRPFELVPDHPRSKRAWT